MIGLIKRVGVTGKKRDSAPFAPTSITGLELWVRGDLGVTQVAGAVSSWADQSGKGDANRNLVQSVAGKKPTLNAIDAAWNNQATLSFASASSQQLDSAGNWAPALAQPFTLILVGEDGGAGFQGWASNTASSLQVNYGNGSADMVGYAGSFLASNQGGTSARKMVAVSFNGVSSAIYENARTARATGAIGATGLDQLTLGCCPGVGIYLNGKLAEALVYSKVLSPGEIDALCSYLASRYSLTIGA